jgi:hypothetical protein
MVGNPELGVGLDNDSLRIRLGHEFLDMAAAVHRDQLAQRSYWISSPALLSLFCQPGVFATEAVSIHPIG